MIHVYDTAGTCLVQQRIGPGDDVAAHALAAADEAMRLTRLDFVLVAYDGDSGRRYQAHDWL